MWLALSNSFLSIVADRKDKNRLLVRARVAGHIEAVFPTAEVFTDRGADYLYRAYIKRSVVAAALTDQIQAIDYDNFKSSVADHELHQAFLRVWSVMRNLQE